MNKNKQKKPLKKSEPKKKRTGENVYVGKFEHVFNKKWQEHEIKALADEMIEWFETKFKNGQKDETGRTPIWLIDFLIMKRINKQRIAEFEKANAYFAQVYDLCRAIQESILFKLGLQTKSPMPIFALKNISGWTDKVDNGSGLNENELESLRSLAKSYLINSI